MARGARKDRDYVKQRHRIMSNVFISELRLCQRKTEATVKCRTFLIAKYRCGAFGNFWEPADAKHQNYLTRNETGRSGGGGGGGGTGGAMV